MALSSSDKRGRLHQPQHHVHFLQGMLRHTHHILAKLVLGLVDPRSVQKDDLSPLVRKDGLNAVSGGLGLI